MNLRPYQEQAIKAVMKDWESYQRLLIVLPTGTGKTVVFSKIAEEIVRRGGKVLILAHRAELLNQARDKIAAITGLETALEKAEETAEDSWAMITVGSVQSFNDKRLERISPDEYTHIIIDEAHHTIASTYMKVINHFSEAKLLGVTATADRGDKRQLGEVYEHLSYEMGVVEAVRDGYLVPIRAMTLPVNINIHCTNGGEFTLHDSANAIEPYLHDIARQVVQHASDRKTVIFLPLISTSQKMLAILQDMGVPCKEVNGESIDRAEVIDWFSHAKPGSVLLNAMLLTEGWDEPSADCVVVLRATKVRSLYVQMVGRGTRLCEGKKDLLILDFLWHTDTHDLCRPTHLVHTNSELAERISEILAENDDKYGDMDLIEAVEEVNTQVVNEREERLAKILEEMKHKRSKLVDPLQYLSSIRKKTNKNDQNLAKMTPPVEKTIEDLAKIGICGDNIETQQEAEEILEMAQERKANSMATPMQIRRLEAFGFQNVGTWSQKFATRWIIILSKNRWRVPHEVNPASVREVFK